ncbi:MAG: cobalamin B12-binding domain-containing protein, partial [Candidatus Lindowbacteria bacterium]|nr:cobalamin B12-binding domain-containing protein [Candidatus Lindowbacteria bacterium]
MPIGSITTQQGVPSIGIAYLLSSLKVAGHEVSAVDSFGDAVNRFTHIENTNLLINGLNAKEIPQRIPKNVQVIGVSCMYSNEWIYSKVVIQEIIKQFPGVPVVGGGEHFTADPEFAMKTCPGIHSVVLGEGEEIFVELVHTIVEGGALGNVPGIAFMQDGKLVKNPP